MNDASPSSPEAADVFISYSSEDRERIDPIVRLVRAMKKDSVFQDFMSIRPGEKWADEIMQALAQCRTVLVFWCTHAAASDWVRQEYEAGISGNKEMIPILLDDTKLPEALGVYQWLDFRRDEPHGGLTRFVPRTFRRSGRHYYPKDEFGEYRDWDWEEYHQEESDRQKRWEASQTVRSEEIARRIVARLTASETDV